MIPFKVKKLRRNIKRIDDERDKGLTTPDNIQRIDNIDFGAGKDHLLDIYRPKNILGKLPIIINVHGGGFKYGDKETYQYYCMDLARRGFVVVNFTYHLAPEYRFPRFFKDTILAFKYVQENSDKYGFDLEKIYAVGDSAGAFMLAQYCIYGTNKNYRNILNIKDTFFIKPKAIGLNCGFYQVNMSQKKDIKSLKLIFEKKTKEEYILNVINLLPYINKEFPPTFIMSANGDFLVSEQPLLQEALNKLGIENEFHIYGDDENKLLHVFHCNIKNPLGTLANDEECAFFKKHS